MTLFTSKSRLLYHNLYRRRLSSQNNSLACLFTSRKNFCEKSTKNIRNLLFNLGKTSYNEFEEELFKTLSEGEQTFPLSKFLYGIKNVGVSSNDPRLSKLFNNINSLQENSQKKEIEINLSQMKMLINENRVFLRQLFINNLIIPDFSKFCTKVDDMYWECRKNFNGTVS